jgi:hypothetical protein
LTPLIGIEGLEGCSQWNFMPIYGRLPHKVIFWCRRLGMHESIRPVAGPIVSLALMGVAASGLIRSSASKALA